MRSQFSGVIITTQKVILYDRLLKVLLRIIAVARTIDFLGIFQCICIFRCIFSVESENDIVFFFGEINR